MDFPSLINLTREIREIEPHEELVIFGSASILASFPEETDRHGWLMLTNDADFILNPWSEETAHRIDRVVGKGRPFHAQQGCYADIVRPDVFDNFPPGFHERLVNLKDFPNVFALEPHDMAVAKLFAGRPKDIELLAVLLSNGKLDVNVLQQRLSATPMTEKWIVRTNEVLKKAILASNQLPNEDAMIKEINS